MPGSRESLVIRFERKFVRRGPEDCWPWTAATNGIGYGKIWVGFDGIRIEYAHRVAFFLKHGRWPTPCGLHSCDNPPCCNPAHIIAGTKRDNSRDMSAKGRSGFQRYPAIINDQRGAGNSHAKLDDERVAEIRRRVAAGEMQKDVAVVMGISRANVSLIVNRKAWK